MNARKLVGSVRSINRGWLAAAMIAAAGASATAQVRSRGGSDDNRNGGVPAQAPRPAPGLGGVRSVGGVRSEAPRPLSGINPPRVQLPGPNGSVLRGTPSAGPRRIGSLGGSPAALPQSQPLGPSRRDPNFRPMDVHPWPGVPNSGLGEQALTPSRPLPGGRVPVFVLPDQRIIRVDGSGLTVDSSFQGDRFRLGLHLGAHPELIAVPVHPGYGFGGGFYRPAYYGDARWWYGDGAYSSCSSCNSYVSGYYTSVDPKLVEQPLAATAPMTEAPPANDRELGDVQLRAGEAKNAVRSYRAWLKANSGDAVALRSLALALIEDSHAKEGVATLALAYKTDPSLATIPPLIDTYQNGAKDWRENLRKLSVYANSSGGSSAWLAVAVFMQAEGRTETARSMVDRASAAGLEPAVVAGMRAALME